jgi:uncharacterized iron-regulated membrane protein
MKTIMRRNLKRLHQLIGVVIALYMLIMAGTGAALTYKDPILARLIPEVGGQVSALGPVDQAAVLARIEEKYAVPGVRSVKLPRPGMNAYKVYLKGKQELLLNADTLAEVNDPLGVSTFFVVLFDIHHRLAAGATGEEIVGILGLVAIFSLLSGLYIWWPWRKGYRFHNLIPANGRPSAYRLSHVTLGATIAPLLLLNTVTGASMIYSTPVRNALTAVFGGEKATVAVSIPDTPEPRIALFENKASHFPEGLATIYIPRRTEEGPYSLRLQMPAEWHPNGRSTVTIDPKVRTATFYNAQDAALGHNIADAIYPLHSGKTGGYLWQALVVLTGLGGFLLAYAGLSAYIRRPRGRMPRPAIK